MEVWAQIYGRDTVGIEEKAKPDGEYVKKRSLRMDLKCLFGSTLSVLRHDGVAKGKAGKDEAEASAGTKEEKQKR